MIFGLVEHLIVSGKGVRGEFANLRSKFDCIETAGFTEAAAHGILIKKLADASAGVVWRSVREFELDVLGDTCTDSALIR